MHTSFQTVTYQDDSELSDIGDVVVEVPVDMSGYPAVVAAAVEAVPDDLYRYLAAVAGNVGVVDPSVEEVPVD